MKTINQQRFEVIAVIITALLKFMLMDWLNLRAFYIAGICMFWLGYIFFRVRSDKEILNLWGFKKEYFKHTILFLLPFVFLVIILSILYSSFNNSLYFSWHIIPVLFLYPVWGIIQQFLMLGIISHNLVTVLEVKVNRYVVIFLISALFSLIHYTSFFLMIFTFFLEVLFIIVYLRWRNLWAIGIAHGLAATFLMFYIMERDLWSELLSSL
jgi:uncharacterized protein